MVEETSLAAPRRSAQRHPFRIQRLQYRAQDGSVLKANATWLQAHPQTRVQVEGHCDERGSEEYNIALGAKRAQSAKDYLVTLGIARQNLDDQLRQRAAAMPRP